MEVFAFPFVLSGVYCRFAYESFRQLTVRYKLLKSFRVRFGSLPQLPRRGETTEVVGEREVSETTGRPFRYVFI